MISLKLKEVMSMTEILTKLSNKEMKAKLAYNIGKILKQLESEITNFNEARMNLIKKYGEKDETGELKIFDDNNYKINQDSINDFNNEFNELIETEIEINANKINFNEIENLDFSPQEIVLLEPILEIEE